MQIWKRCLDQLETKLSAQQFNTWIRPLHVIEDEQCLRLLAPNRFVLDWVNEHFLNTISELVTRAQNGSSRRVSLEIGGNTSSEQQQKPAHGAVETPNRKSEPTYGGRYTQLNPQLSFDNFVAGKSNQMARAASLQVSENIGGAYNPLFIYGGVGLGKTHLLHAVGNAILQRHPHKKVAYLHSERFVADMVTALQHNTLGEFKRFYRGLDALLIDDIQFFIGKERSQEEFFHTFND